MKSLLKFLLKFFAVRILKKYQPKIVAITGSVGKTSTREAVYLALHGSVNVRRSQKSFNTEYGLPLTIIGATTAPGWNLPGWLAIFTRACDLLLRRQEYPEVLVLEMALDHPGDIDYLVSIAQPYVGVVTAIGGDFPVHVEFFKDVDALVDEKMLVLTRTPAAGFAILNVDDAHLLKRQQQIKAKIITFGQTESAAFRVRDVHVTTDIHASSQDIGLSFKIEHQGASVPFFLPGILGQHLAHAAIIAAAVGRIFDINLVTIAERLRQFEAVPGRLHLIDGIKHTFILDDTYNASPAATAAAIDSLAALKAPGRKWAVLADMLELGQKTVPAHTYIGEKIVAAQLDLLVVVGERARIIAQTAREQGMSTDVIFEFANNHDAGRFIQERLEPGDIVLLKGSQSMRLEQVVKEIMAEPLRAGELLVRQTPDWLNR